MREIAASILTLTILVGACQPGGAPNAQPPPQSSTSPNAASEQVFRFNLGSEPPGLDPQYASWDASISVLQALFDPMLGFDENLRLRPAVAREIPTLDNGGISRDARTYTFKLRDDYRWTDGQRL